MKSKDRSSRFPILLNVYESLYSVVFLHTHRLPFFFLSCQTSIDFFLYMKLLSPNLSSPLLIEVETSGNNGKQGKRKG